MVEWAGNSDNPLIARIMRCVSVDERGCWIWTGLLNRPGGYGRIQDPRIGRQVSVHRVMYEAANDVTLTKSNWVLHRCDMPPCCNPDHLFIGTQAENAADMVQKGRALQKLDFDQIAQIGDRLKAGVSKRDLAREFGVSEPAIHYWSKKMRKKHV